MTEHSCHICEDYPLAPEDTMLYDWELLYLSCHELFWGVVEALKIPELAEWLNNALQTLFLPKR